MELTDPVGVIKLSIGKGTMKRERAFTLVELLVVMAVVGILAALLLPVLGRSRERAKAVYCLSNLRQWGQALRFYAFSNNNYLPPEGWANPPIVPSRPVHINSWYVLLPREIRLPTYYEMTWRTNAGLHPGHSVWLCPANPRRSTGTNLFHYCLNGNVDGSGATDHQIDEVGPPTSVVYLFDSKNLPAVGSWSFVHTNLHNHGAQFLFLDGHAARFRNTAYWDFKRRRALTNNPELVWIPR